MRKMLIGIVGFVLGTSVLLAFTMPTPEQISQAAKNPSEIAALIDGASGEQISQILNLLAQEIESWSSSVDEKQGAIAQIAAELQTKFGDTLMPVLADALKTFPDLLPGVGSLSAPVAPPVLPIAQPLAPPIAPKYEGQ